MQKTSRSHMRVGTSANRLFRWAAVLFPLSIAGGAFGQGYLVPPQGFQGAPAVPTMGNVNTSAATPNGQVGNQTIEQISDQANGVTPGTANTPSGQASTGSASGAKDGGKSDKAGGPLMAPADSLMRWGALHAHVRASYQFLYDTGIHSQPGVATDTETHTLTPGISLDLGPHVGASYDASLRFFSQKNFHNTVDHSFGLNGGIQVGDWSLGAIEGFTITDEPLVETSGQTKQTAFSSSLVAIYSASEKLSLATTVGIGLNYVGSGTNGFGGGVTNALSKFSDSQSYSGSEILDYKFTDKISGGAGVTVGYTEQGGGFRSLEEQFNGHIGWHPGSKLSSSVSVGVEHREFLDSNAQALWNPIYSASISYQLFEQTSLSLNGSRAVGASLFQNQVTETTRLGIGLQQRLLGTVQLNLGFGYTMSDYKSTTGNLSTARSDSGTSYSAGLSVPFLTRCNFSTFYQFSENSSSSGGFGYSSSQVGASLSWAY